MAKSPKKKQTGQKMGRSHTTMTLGSSSDKPYKTGQVRGSTADTSRTSLLQDATRAGRISQNQSNFGGSGTTSGATRVARAQENIRKLTRSGVRINPNTATPFTQEQMSSNKTWVGRLRNKMYKK